VDMKEDGLTDMAGTPASKNAFTINAFRSIIA
jgi:hypothetical protein